MSERRFVVAGTACAAALLLWGFRNHELWRDEAQAFLLARDAPSFWSLITGEARRYEGHPFLWFCLLRFASRLTASHLALSVVAFTVSLSNVALTLSLGFLPRWQRLPLAVSYFSIFEYGILARSYGLAWTCLLLALHAAWRRRHLAFGLALGAAVCTVIAASIPAAVAVLCFYSAELRRFLAAPRSLLARPRTWLLGPAAFGALSLVAVATTPVPRDAVAQLGPWPRPTLGLLLECGERLFRATVPVPEVTPYDGMWWSTNQFMPDLARLGYVAAGDRAWVVGLSCFGLAIAASFLWVLRRDWPAGVALGLGLAATLGLFLRLPVRAIRYDGHLELCIVMAVATVSLRKPAHFSGWCARALIAFCFGASALAAAVALYQDATRPFSQSENVARRLRELGAPRVPTVGVEYYRMAPVAAYLGTELYSAEHGRVVSYGIWSTRWHHPGYASGSRPVVRQALCWALARARERGAALLVTTGKIELPASVARYLELDSSFSPSQAGEDYWVYRAEPSPLGAAPAEWGCAER